MAATRPALSAICGSIRCRWLSWLKAWRRPRRAHGGYPEGPDLNGSRLTLASVSWRDALNVLVRAQAAGRPGRPAPRRHPPARAKGGRGDEPMVTSRSVAWPFSLRESGVAGIFGRASPALKISPPVAAKATTSAALEMQWTFCRSCWNVVAPPRPKLTPKPGTAWAALRRPMPGCRAGNYAVTACFWSLLVTWMLRGLAASWTGMVRVSTPAE